jgi:hypothetical protein
VPDFHTRVFVRPKALAVDAADRTSCEHRALPVPKHALGAQEFEL